MIVIIHERGNLGGRVVQIAEGVTRGGVLSFFFQSGSLLEITLQIARVYWQYINLNPSTLGLGLQIASGGVFSITPLLSAKYYYKL